MALGRHNNDVLIQDGLSVSHASRSLDSVSGLCRKDLCIYGDTKLFVNKRHCFKSRLLIMSGQGKQNFRSLVYDGSFYDDHVCLGSSFLKLCGQWKTVLVC
jgi:hypothetical protein